MRGAANTPAISNPEFDRFAPPQGSRVTTVPPPVRSASSIPSALSMSAVSTQRTGSIQAVLPGSGIKVSRATPHVPQTARRMGVVESQVQTPNVDDGFEL